MSSPGHGVDSPPEGAGKIRYTRGVSMRKGVCELQRTVQYWRLVKQDGKPLDGAFPAEGVVSALVAAEAEEKDRHRICADGTVLIGHGVAGPPHHLLVLNKVRRENLPGVGDSVGARRPIGLNEGEGLLEPTYCLFGENNVVAMLTSGNGPRARRLCDYLRAKLGVDVGLDPVLTQDLDRVLDEMKLSSVEIAVPAHAVTRDLIGGDWASALNANRVLVQDGGVIRVGVTVGRRGTREQKGRIRDSIRGLVNQLRGSGSVEELNSARVTGTVNGTQRSVDLYEDRFVEKIDVEADRLNDPERSAAYARSVLSDALRESRSYLDRAVPLINIEATTDHIISFIEKPDDESNRQ